MRHYNPNQIIFLIIIFATNSMSNAIFMSPVDDEYGPIHIGINSDLYGLYYKQNKNFQTSYISIKPYLEYMEKSIIISPNLRLSKNDAFILTLGAEAGPSLYLGKTDGIGYNGRLNAHLIFLFIAMGLRTPNIMKKPRVLVEFGISVPIPLLGKNHDYNNYIRKNKRNQGKINGQTTNR